MPGGTWSYAPVSVPVEVAIVEFSSFIGKAFRWLVVGVGWIDYSGSQVANRKCHVASSRLE